MLKINSNFSNSQTSTDTPLEDTPEKIIESTVIVESENPSISVDTVISQEDTSSIYAGSIIVDSSTSTEVQLNTVVINTKGIVNCSKLIAKNKSTLCIKWSLVDLCGVSLYTTPTSYPSGSICKINFNKINLQNGTKFKLIAIICNNETIYSCITLKFDNKHKDTANFILRGSAAKTALLYEGLTEN